MPDLIKFSRIAAVRKGKRIQYEYDGLNRLTKINYPYSEAVVYEYGGYSAGGREDNAAGRVTRVRDESGSIEYKYGKLGQVEREHRVIKLLPLSSGKTKSGEMKYASDYLGRMKEITYPDGEVVRYGYGYGGQIKSVTGERIGTKFDYVTNIGYDEYGQRVYIMYGNGAETEYKYDPYRRWLSGLDTNSGNAGKVQDMKYNFDSVGNVLGYENNARGYTTKQSYSYDALYQLTGVQGTSRSHPYGGNEEYKTDYRQKFDFNRIGNMTNKISEESVSNTNRIGAELNYALEYEYYKGTHKAERIGNRYYDYDLNGNVLAEREGSHAVNKEADRAYYQEGDKYWADYGFGLVKPKPDATDDGVYQRNYKWNERNLLSETSDNTYTVQYRYGSDGQRALKLNAASGRSVVYFNKMWQTSDSRMEWLQSKHIYLNEDRIATKYNSEGNTNTQAEKERTYYYHSDHLGSAQVVTNWKGQIHERLEYTPYGELWIDWKGDTGLEDKTPFRFAGKEMDAETGFYYYGARYMDPKTSRWISADPALGEYVPGAGQGGGELPGIGGVFNYVNLHVYHYAGNNPVNYTDPTGMWHANGDGTVTFDNDNDTLAQGAAAAGWDNWKDALQGNNKGAIFYRDYKEIDVSSWYNDNGDWIGGDNTLVGITMSNKEPTFDRPTSGVVSSEYGMRPDPFDPEGKEKFHGGVDIKDVAGTIIKASAFGVVSEITKGDDVWGNTVVVRHGSGYTTRYAHLDKITDWTYGKGTVLHKNNKVGTMGNTGKSKGIHLHFGLYRNGNSMDPEEKVKLR